MWCWSKDEKVALPSEPSQVFGSVRDQVHNKEIDALLHVSPSRRVQWYTDNSFFLTRRFFRKFLSMRNNSVLLDSGVTGLLACRMKSIWLAPAAAWATLIDEKYKTECPCCEEPHRESMSHLLLKCPRWTVQRVEHLFPILDAINEIDASLSASAVVTLMLGGSVRRAAPLSALSLRKKFMVGASPLFLYVASFLGSIKKDRDTLLWRTSKSRLASGSGDNG